MNERLDDLWREVLSAQVSRDLMWTKQSRRGRWAVVEPAPTLPGSPPNVRAIVAAVSERRGRRFSSLSRARAFARQVDGRVVHWRARHWKRISPWQRAAKHAGLGALRLVHLAQLEVVP
jgi:hypothetical protein